ncbi:MAG: hypothetical protein R3C68_06890 [Myxococcota bacterium]
MSTDPKGYETQDAHPRPILVAGCVFGALVGIALVIASMFIGRFQDRQQELFVASPMAQRKLPPLPRLQTDEKGDLQRWRNAQREHLSTYGWVSSEHQYAHIPISVAMQNIAREGLPTWPIEQAHSAPGATP